MELQHLSFLLGALLLLISLFGTGLEVKEFRIARAGTCTRIVSALLGMAFIVLGLWLWVVDRPEMVEHLLDHPGTETPPATVAEKTPAPAIAKTPPATAPAESVVPKPQAPAAKPEKAPPAEAAPRPVDKAATKAPPPSRKPEKPAAPEVKAVEPVVQIPAPEVIAKPDETLLDDGFEVDTHRLSGWNLGEKLGGRRGVGGYQTVYHDTNSGAGKSHRSLAMEFRIGTVRKDRHLNWPMRARIKSDEPRDLSRYRGVHFKIRSDARRMVRFVLWDQPPGTNDTELWRKDIWADREWRQVWIPFTELMVMEQHTTNNRRDLEHVIALAWVVNEQILSPGEAGTIWIDDIGFF